MNYGNLKAENILIKIAQNGKRIESIKLINFGYVLVLGEEEQIIVPEKIDHCPQEFLHMVAETVKINEQDSASQDYECAPLT